MALLVTTTLTASVMLGTGRPALAEAAQEACYPIEPVEVVEPDFVVFPGDPLTSVLYYCLKFYAGVTNFDLPDRGYLAREEIATRNLETDFIKPSATLDGYNVGTEFEFGREISVGVLDAYRTGLNVRFNLEYSDASESQQIGQIDFGPGFGLGIPGAEGGASGAFLAANPANIIEDAAYHADLEWGGFEVNTEFRVEDPEHRWGKGLYVGAIYSDVSLREEFSGRIPGFNSDFRYVTDLDTEAYGAHIGVRGRHEVGNPIHGWQPQISARARVGVADIDAEATDSVNWGGFISGLVPDSQVRLHDSKTAAYYGIGGAFSLFNDELGSQISFDAAYETRPWFASVQRDGTNPSRLAIGNAKVMSFRMSYRHSF